MPRSGNSASLQRLSRPKSKPQVTLIQLAESRASLSRVRLFAVIALAAGALVLSAASSPAGATAAKQTKALGFNCVSSCADYESTIDQFFTDVAADSGLTTNVYSTLTQYSNIEYNTTFAGSYVDGSPFPTTRCHDGFDKYCVTDKQLRAEMGKVIAANNWPTNTTTDLYFIFTPANVGVCEHAGRAIDGVACTTNAFCAYHNATNNFIYAVEPDDAAVSEGGCDTGQSPAGNSADSTLSTISHEHSEAITDPYGNGWTSEDHETYMGIPDAFFGSENGDLCSWNFGDSLGTLDGQEYNQVINGHAYYLQQEYSNIDGGCVQHVGGTPTNFDSSNPLYAGVGPLVYHDGTVMTTNTVYAIYWVPVAPANGRLPRIGGIAKVGKQLRAFHGTWSNSLSFTYRWLRCSSSGTSCTGIKRATGSSYTLAQADAGHRLEVRVTATNQAGRANAVSAPTRKVRP